MTGISSSRIDRYCRQSTHMPDTCGRCSYSAEYLHIVSSECRSVERDSQPIAAHAHAWLKVSSGGWLLATNPDGIGASIKITAFSVIAFGSAVISGQTPLPLIFPFHWLAFCRLPVGACSDLIIVDIWIGKISAPRREQNHMIPMSAVQYRSRIQAADRQDDS